MTFEGIQGRLMANVKKLIQNGELSERGFARFAGISQAHVHNVLKGIRSLSRQKSDLILQTLNYSVLDLCTAAELTEYLAGRSTRSSSFLDMPFLTERIGPGMPWSTQLSRNDVYSVPCEVAGDRRQLVLARLSDDSEMDYFTADRFNIVLLDTASSEWFPEFLYAVDRGPDTVLRRVRAGTNKIYLATDANLDDPLRWECIPLPLWPRRLRGRVKWLGTERYRDARPAPTSS